MEPKSLIQTFFGKEAGITIEDIEKTILGRVKESVLMEYKRIEKLEDRKLIAQEIVAFLNKSTAEGGIVVLGIEAKDKVPTNIIGVKNSIIRDGSVLRDWIRNDISSNPRFFEFPSISIETVPLGKDKTVYLIECHPKDSNVLYYSKCDETAYVREIDTTRKLQFEETARLIDSKKIAKLFANLERINLQHENDFVVYTIKIVFNNRGNKPANNVLGIFLFDCINIETKEKNIEVTFFDTRNVSDISNINVCAKSYQQTYSQLFYPGRPVVVANFTLRFLREKPIHLILEIDEQCGRTRQEYTFTEGEFSQSPIIFSSY